MQHLYNLLPVGAENAINIKYLAELWDMKPRVARRTIEQMWYHDMPTINTGNGYYRPASEKDLCGYEAFIYSYVLKLHKKLYRIKKATENFKQISFTDGQTHGTDNKTAV